MYFIRFCMQFVPAYLLGLTLAATRWTSVLCACTGGGDAASADEVAAAGEQKGAAALDQPATAEAARMVVERHGHTHL